MPALAALCDQLNATSTRYPGTELTLRYEVKTQPAAWDIIPAAANCLSASTPSPRRAAPV